jgi:hypothetical protein
MASIPLHGMKPVQIEGINAVGVTGRMTGKPEVMHPGWQIAPDNGGLGSYSTCLISSDNQELTVFPFVSP